MKDIAVGYGKYRRFYFICVLQQIMLILKLGFGAS